MGYQETKTSDAIKFTDYEGKPFEGYYLGSRVADTKEFGESTIHRFQSKKDNTVKEFWGFDRFNRLMMNVPARALCKITYLGKKAQSNDSTKTYHDIQVLHDAENILALDKAHVQKKENDDLPF